jgi:hypothetical protein
MIINYNANISNGHKEELLIVEPNVRMIFVSIIVGVYYNLGSTLNENSSNKEKNYINKIKVINTYG